MKRLPFYFLHLLLLTLPAIHPANSAPSIESASAVTATLQEAAKPKWLSAAEDYATPEDLPDEITVDTVFGAITVTEPVLIELLQHPVVERMKEIDQHGPPTYFIKRESFSRYDHCLGVFALLRMHQRPLSEQVAGLLHDASHTVFSHIADHLFKTGNQHSYQDAVHSWYLQKMQVDKVLERHGLTIEEINPDQPHYTALEQKHPRLCADRLQYILHTGLVLKKLTAEEVEKIVSSLHFEKNSWFFDDQESARKLADLSVYCTEYIWSAPVELAWRHWLCSALLQAIAINLINSDDIHFGVDRDVLERLNNSPDKHIKEMMEKCYSPQKGFKAVPTSAPYDMLDMPKIRAVDPLIRSENGLASLTDQDAEYRLQVEGLRGRLSGGVRIKFIPEA